MVFDSLDLYNLDGDIFKIRCRDIKSNTILIRNNWFNDYFYIGDTVTRPFNENGKPIDREYKMYGIFRETLPFLEGYESKKVSTSIEHTQLSINMYSVQEIYNLHEGKAEETLGEYLTKNIKHIDRLYSNFILKNTQRVQK